MVIFSRIAGLVCLEADTETYVNGRRVAGEGALRKKVERNRLAPGERERFETIKRI